MMISATLIAIACLACIASVLTIRRYRLEAASLRTALDTTFSDHVTHVFTRYFRQVQAVVSGVNHVYSGCMRVPLDHMFLKDVESHVGISSAQTDRFRMEVLFAICHYTMETRLEPTASVHESLGKAINIYVLRRMRIGELSSVLSSHVRAWWLTLRYGHRAMNPVSMVVHGYAYNDAMRHFRQQHGRD